MSRQSVTLPSSPALSLSALADPARPDALPAPGDTLEQAIDVDAPDPFFSVAHGPLLARSADAVLAALAAGPSIPHSPLSEAMISVRLGSGSPSPMGAAASGARPPALSLDVAPSAPAPSRKRARSASVVPDPGEGSPTVLGASSASSLPDRVVSTAGFLAVDAAHLFFASVRPVGAVPSGAFQCLCWPGGLSPALLVSTRTGCALGPPLLPRSWTVSLFLSRVCLSY
jgi:hypothetical protein